MCEKYIAWTHVPMNNRTSTAFFMKKTQALCSADCNSTSLVPVKNIFCIICGNVPISMQIRKLKKKKVIQFIKSNERNMR